MTNIIKLHQKKEPSLFMSLVLSISIFFLTKSLGESLTLLFYYILPKKINLTLISVVSMMIAFSLIIFIYYKGLKKFYRKDLMKEINYSWIKDFEGFFTISIFFLVSLMLQFLASYLIINILGEPIPNGSTTTTETLKEYSGLGYIFISIIYPILFAPFFEEIIYRGILGSLFSINSKGVSRLNKGLFLLTSSILFASLHYQVGLDLTSQVNILVLTMISGLVYGAIYLKSGNLLFPIMLHILQNAFVLIF